MTILNTEQKINMIVNNISLTLKRYQYQTKKMRPTWTFLSEKKWNYQNIEVYPFQSCFSHEMIILDLFSHLLHLHRSLVKLSMWSEPQLSALKETSFCNSLVTKLFVNCIWPKLHFFLYHQKTHFCEFSKAIDSVDMSCTVTWGHLFIVDVLE